MLFIPFRMNSIHLFGGNHQDFWSLFVHSVLRSHSPHLFFQQDSSPFSFCQETSHEFVEPVKTPKVRHAKPWGPQSLISIGLSPTNSPKAKPICAIASLVSAVLDRFMECILDDLRMPYDWTIWLSWILNQGLSWQRHMHISYRALGRKWVVGGFSSTAIQKVGEVCITKCQFAKEASSRYNIYDMIIWMLQIAAVPPLNIMMHPWLWHRCEMLCTLIAQDDVLSPWIVSVY